ncbi:MAG TPA: RelA/SpoT family protein [Candidatus Paceibacterota bacterium]|jgi:GTP pyrophosphokinase|nr:RelA/SpoT family protein [Candidatus Paceibacterota bacterium]
MATMSGISEILGLMPEKATKKDEELIIKAYKFAEAAHATQKRNSGEPYFIHVFETAKTLASLGMDAQTIAAGLLHDTLEDTDTTEEQIRREFNEDILFLIKGVTKLSTLKYSGYERHVESLRKFFMAMANDLRVVIIKLADRLHNLNTLEHVREDKRKRIALESISVYAPLANRLGMGGLKGDIEDAAFPFAYPKEYKEMEEILKKKQDFYKMHLSEVSEKLKKELERNKIKNFAIDYRVKHKYSLYKKLLKYDMDIDKIYDIVALRVVVENVEECYRVLGIIHSLWNPLPGRIKDYIAIPKPNGYRSIHTTIFTGSGGVAEIQIKTAEMHLEATYGVAAHFAYKEKAKRKKANDPLKFKWIEDLKNLKYSPEDPKKFIEHLHTDFFNDRIFVFTPKGDVVDLPEDSSPVDFAYNIHSDIGNHIAGAKINDKMSQIFSKLKNGDVVKIIINKNSHPSTKWLEYVKTTVAKKHIKHYLEKNTLLSKLKSIGK